MKTVSGLSTAALILGILGIFPLTGTTSIPALICGYLSRRAFRANDELEPRETTWGIWLGWAGIVLIILLAVAAHFTHWAYFQQN
jgi:uncharacterized membrane protein (UPF0136 family)